MDFCGKGTHGEGISNSQGLEGQTVYFPDDFPRFQTPSILSMRPLYGNLVLTRSRLMCKSSDDDLIHCVVVAFTLIVIGFVVVYFIISHSLLLLVLLW